MLPKSDPRRSPQEHLAGSTLAKMVVLAIEYVCSDETLAALDEVSVTRKVRVLAHRNNLSIGAEEGLRHAVRQGLHRHDPSRFPCPGSGRPIQAAVRRIGGFLGCRVPFLPSDRPDPPGGGARSG